MSSEPVTFEQCPSLAGQSAGTLLGKELGYIVQIVQLSCPSTFSQCDLLYLAFTWLLKPVNYVAGVGGWCEEFCCSAHFLKCPHVSTNITLVVLLVKLLVHNLNVPISVQQTPLLVHHHSQTLCLRHCCKSTDCYKIMIAITYASFGLCICPNPRNV